MTSAEIRQSFLDFFRSKQHTIVPSSSLLPDAPNLLFTNAGMNQFVPIFLGQKAPDVSKWAGASPALDTRAADTQKCIRAGGKHNDLEDVGFDTYHHTFFEMLGNWSFGDYFKQEAIAWAWELVTEVWRFPKHRLYATVYQPGPGEPAEFDQEAFAHWARLFTAAGLDPKVHICTGGKKDNFWMMGETGPCGPCSELHIDLTPAANTGGRLVNAGSAQCIEIWNLVFIQFNAGPDGTFSPLPARHVDTGMGFERVTGIIQNTRGLTDFSRPISNYETDIFRPLFDELERLSGKEYCSTLPAKQNLAAASPTPGTADAAPNTPSACVSTNMGSADNSTGMGSAYNSTGTGSADNSTGMGSADNSTGTGSADNSTGMGSAGVPPAAVGVPPTAAAGDTPGCPPRSAARDAQQSDRDGRAPQARAPQAHAPQAHALQAHALQAHAPQARFGATYYRRRLPHFERPWAKYMVSFSTHARRQLSPQARDVVLKSLLYGHQHRRYLLYAGCVMPDHVHMLLEPQVKEQDSEGNPVFWPLSTLLHSLKSFTAHEINKLEHQTGPLWESESFDRLIRGDADLQEKYEYICRNPWESGLVSPAEDYDWLWTWESEAACQQVVATATVATSAVTAGNSTGMGSADNSTGTGSADNSTGMGSADNSTGMGSADNSTGTGSADNSTGTGSADNSTGMGSADNSTGMGSAGVPPAAVGVSPTAAAGDTPGCLPHPAARDAQQSDRDGRAPQACAPQACPPQACPQTETQVQLDVAFRVIADHLRTLSFAIADGIQPSNDGRGYVLRRILRRAVRYGRSLGLHEPFFFKLVDVLAETMGGVFPEIRAKQKHVQEVIRVEEEAFNRTLDRGIALFNQEVAGLADGCSRMRGEFAFKLYDTYGFPLDLTELMARERGLTVDVAGFDTLMAEQRDRARKAQKKQVVALSQIETQAPTVFVGYDKLETTAKVLELVGLKDKTAVVLDTSACYAEMGGQLGDTGELSQGNRSWRIVGTLKNGDTWLHFIEEDGARGSGPRAAVGGEASERGAVGETPTAAGETPALPALPALPMLGTEIMVTVDAARRAAIQRHHTVTHLLHWALHQVVSPDVAQKGSFVGPDKLTFDFNSAPLAPAQVAAVERLVNERILENAPVTWLEAKYDHIKNRPDIMQFFGEKYSEWVRVVQIGGTPTALDGYAMELCGGTHCRAVGEIGLFRILAENAIAAGVRRIEAVAGLEAYRQASDELALLKSIAGKVNAPVGELERRIESMLEQQRALDKRLRALAQQQAAQAARDLVARAQTVNGMPVIVARVDGDGDALQGLVNELKGQFKGVILLGGVAQGAVAFVASVSPEFTARVQAGKLIQQIAPVVGGKGGGKPDNARGGGKETARIDEALAKGRSLVG